jgi:ribosome-binding factor A
MADEKGNRRLLRIEKELRDVIGRFLISGFPGELEGLVTVSRVQVNGDLRDARVFVSIFGTPEQQEANMDELERYARDVQDEVNHQLRMKFTPRLEFVLDKSLEKQLKVEKIIHDLAKEREAQAKAKKDDKG